MQHDGASRPGCEEDALAFSTSAGRRALPRAAPHASSSDTEGPCSSPIEQMSGGLQSLASRRRGGGRPACIEQMAACSAGGPDLVRPVAAAPVTRSCRVVLRFADWRSGCSRLALRFAVVIVRLGYGGRLRSAGGRRLRCSRGETEVWRG